MKKIFLFGDFKDSFVRLAGKFVKAAGGNEANIAVLMQGEARYETYFLQYEKILKELGATKIFPIFPKNESIDISPKQMNNIKDATGILMCGGNTHRYISIYGENKIGAVIKEKYESGTPYAGVSAGAIVATHLGLLPNYSIKPHFSELNRFNELINKMKKKKISLGLGMDNGIRVEISDDDIWQIVGRGALYIFNYKDDSFCFKIYYDGDRFSVENKY